MIIGAGIQGLSSAYHLTELGVNDILVLEKAPKVASGSSSRSASMVMLQRETEAKIALSVYSYLWYLRFNEVFGVQLPFTRIGFLSVATPAAAPEVLQKAELRQRLGIPTDIVSPDEIQRLEPVVDVRDIEVGVFGPDDGYIDVPTIITTLVDAVVDAGVTIRCDAEVTGIKVADGKVREVCLRGERVPCDVVVNAAGAEAKTIAGYVGLDLPIDNRRRSILLSKHRGDVRSTSPMVEDAEAQYYFRPTPSGVLFGLGKDVDTRISRSIDPDVVATARAFAASRFPSLANIVPYDGWSGLRPLTPDLAPILGPPDGVSGFINSCGWGGEGIQHAPAGGKITAECVVYGRSRCMNLAPYRLERFTA